jgi:hypothetical protein
LLERSTTSSYFLEPRWSAQGREVLVPDLIRFVDERVPADADIALAITPSDPGYVVLGPGLDRHPVSLGPANIDRPGPTWALVSHPMPRHAALPGVAADGSAPLRLGAVPAAARAMLSPKRATGLEPATFSLEG